MKKINALIASLISLFVPLYAYAQSNASLDRGIGNISTTIDLLTRGIVKNLVTLFATMAMAAFFFGIVQYIWGIREGVEKKIEDGRKFMIWSLAALFVMFSVWGIIIFFQNTLGIGGNNRIIIPEIQIGGATNQTPASPLGNPSANPKPVGFCPDGTPYYRQNDYANVCGSGTFNCSTITDEQTCTAMACSWDFNAGCHQ